MDLRDGIIFATGKRYFFTVFSFLYGPLMASAKDGEIPKSSGRFAILTTLGQPNAKEIGDPKESSESNSSIRRSTSIGDINTAMKEQDKQKKLAAKARKDAEKSEKEGFQMVSYERNKRKKESSPTNESNQKPKRTTLEHQIGESTSKQQDTMQVSHNDTDESGDEYQTPPLHSDGGTEAGSLRSHHPLHSDGGTEEGNGSARRGQCK